MTRKLRTSKNVPFATGRSMLSMFELELDMRRLQRRMREFEDGKYRVGLVESLLNDAWDALLAYWMAMLYATLRLVLLVSVWGVILVALVLV